MKMVRALLFALSLGGLFVGLKLLQESPPRKVGKFLAHQERSVQSDTGFVETEPALAQERPQRQPAARSSRKGRAAGGQSAVVRHAPTQAKTGEPVIITAEFKTAKPGGDVTLQYQVVEPGQYIALKDSAFEKRWESAPMNDRGEGGDKAAGDGVFTVQLPGTVQKHRRLVRYRIRSGQEGKVIAPDEADSQPNYAYFVYDGVPSWQGAINLKASERKLRQPVTYPAQALERVPVYHLIGSKSAVEKATWSQGDGFGGGRNEYHYTGTLVYDGVVYDHVEFRARGGSWRHAMGKNMWKFNFLPGHRFQARDFYGKPYDAKWDKLNLGACIQQGDYGMRGEQGMFEAVGFRLFNLAGAEAPCTT